MSPTASAKELATSIGFTEGPVWLPSGALWVTSISRGLLYRVDIGGAGAVVAAETGGGPNGLALGPGGVVYVAQNGNATIQSRSPRPVKAGVQAVAAAEVDGTVAGEVDDVLADGCSAPNDLVFGPDGRVWFTDPGRPEPCVRAFDPGSGNLTTEITGIGFPNGLAFSSDGLRLFVADSETGDIIRYEMRRGGASAPETFCHLPGTSPDGIAFDAQGRLYVAAFATDEIIVVGPDGQPVEAIPTGPGSRPTNLCFAGDGLSRLAVTAASGGKVLLLDGAYRGTEVAPWTGR